MVTSGPGVSDRRPTGEGTAAFRTIWSGQLVSLLGSVLTEFALGVWIFQRTGSVTEFALFNLFVFLPQIVVMPFGGVLADRYSRRTIMLVANAGGLGTTLVLLALQGTGSLQVWSAYAIALSFAAFSSLLVPAYLATVPQLVPEHRLGRANAMVQFATSVARMASPAVGGVLVTAIGIGGVAVLDMITFGIAIATLLPLRLERPSGGGPRRHILREVADGLRYILSQPGLRGMLLFVACFNVAGGASQALTTPLVLELDSPQDLGLVVGAGGVGLISGALWLTIWDGPRRRIHGVLGGGIVMGLAMVLPAVNPSVPVLAVWTFVQHVCLSVGVISSMAIWHKKVPGHLQGRVFGSLRTISYTALIGTVAVAGPLAERVFEPAMAESGALAGSAGGLLGVGDGRGIALLLLVSGLFPLVGAVVGYLNRKVRRVEDD
ncbi:putative MFS family arabinose efflux permease [Actinokineospora baliensis]|uniref:MFS transporter n=1 Tax=Actinokineospora baliensis TaxID=547056 RepID=UPI00195E5A6D|nr:MFS transporter [Actinokineospora baliensis]MBM7774662.1 putative MFS family arabinose efflux permease [Actinokineospora baliensis]